MFDEAMEEFRGLLDSGTRDIKKWRKFKGMFKTSDSKYPEIFFTLVGVKGGRFAFLFKWK